MQLINAGCHGDQILIFAHLGCYGLRKSIFSDNFFCKMVFVCECVEFSVKLGDLEPTGLFRYCAITISQWSICPFPTL